MEEDGMFKWLEDGRLRALAMFVTVISSASILAYQVRLTHEEQVSTRMGVEDLQTRMTVMETKLGERISRADAEHASFAQRLERLEQSEFERRMDAGRKRHDGGGGYAGGGTR